MRFAAIADVHGNILALEAVLADIRAQGVDDIVNLGDMASGALDPRRTMDRLMALDAVHVLGNHDRYLIDQPPEKMGPWDRPAHAQLDAVHLDWLAALPPMRSFSAMPRLQAVRSIGWIPCFPTAMSPHMLTCGSSNWPKAWPKSWSCVRLRISRLLCASPMAG